MAGRTCGTCGAAVPVLADRCPGCGADPSVALVDVRDLELGDRRRSSPRAGDRRRRTWWPLVVGLLVLGGVAGLLVGGADDDARPTPRTEPERAVERPVSATSSTTTTRPPSPFRADTGLLVTSFGSSMVVDLDSGEEVHLRTTVLGAHDGRLLVDFGAGLAWWPAPFDGQGAELLAEGLQADEVWVDQADGTVWLHTYGRERRLTSIEADGTGRVDHELPLLFVIHGPVGGRLVVGGPGGTYAIEHAGAIERISTGTAVGIGVDAVVVTSCDEALRCTVDLLSGSGEVRGTLPIDALDVGFGPAVVSTDGRLASLSYDDDGSSALVVDGTVVIDDHAGLGHGLVWSPDGGWLVVWTDTGLLAIDPSTLEVFEVPSSRAVEGGWPLIVLDG